MIKRHTKPNPGQEHPGRYRRARGVAARVQRAAGLPGVRRPDAHRPQDPRRRPQGPHLPQVRGSGRQMSRPEGQVPEGRRAGAAEGVRLQERDGRAADREGRREHGPGRGDAERKLDRHGRRRARPHHRAEARDAPREEVDRAVQGPQGHADRHDGHAARRADVGVPRPPDEHRAAARPRLQGRVAPRVRRPRQLHAGPSRSAAVPRDRLHEGRQGARHERVGRDDGQDRRRSAEAAAVHRHAVPR